MSRGEARAFAGWLAAAQKMASGREGAMRIARRLLYHSLSVALAVWVAQKLLVLKQRERATCIVRRLLNQSLSMALTVWVAQARVVQKQHERATCIVSQILNRNISIGFQTWVYRTQTLLKSKQVAMRCVHRLLYRCVVVAWEDWCLFLATQEELRAQKQLEESVHARVDNEKRMQKELESMNARMENEKRTQKDIEQTMTAELETEHASVCSMRQRIMQLEMELESIRQILEWRAGEEYLRLVKASLGYVPPGWAEGVGGKKKKKTAKVSSAHHMWEDRYDTRELSRALISNAKRDLHTHAPPARDGLHGPEGIKFIVTDSPSKVGPGGRKSGGMLMTVDPITPHLGKKTAALVYSNRSAGSSMLKSRNSEILLFTPNKSKLLEGESTFALSPDSIASPSFRPSPAPRDRF